MVSTTLPPAPLLQITLLGSFQLHYQETAVTALNTSRLQSLLAYLVLHRAQTISRQQIAFLFWPDSSEAQARTNLRNLLHKLRTVLPHADQFLSIDQHTLLWQSSAPFHLDVDEFLARAGQSTSIPDRTAAVQLYAGDFLPECYDDWAQNIRESLRQTYLITLEKLLLALTEACQWQEALHYGQILLRQEPTREETYRQLMQLYAQSGDRASVVRLYQTCIMVLARELGVEPSPVTQQAYETFIAQAIDWTRLPEPTQDFSQPVRLHNLPASLTSFIGREQELAQVKKLLAAHRLVTLLGPGGIGKTRLALAATREIVWNYREGICLVDLAPINSSGLVTAAIADALQASDKIQAAGVDSLIDFLYDQHRLLLLDNCEHLTEEVGPIAVALLQACPELRILTTSREALNVYGEALWQVPALPQPQPIERLDAEEAAANSQALSTNESVALFIERAQSTLPTIRPTMEILLQVGEICRRLDGMPLAIEMAAARVKTLTVPQIVQRLDNVLDLLKPTLHSLLPRHRTMEAVMDWSYQMLSAPERQLFERLSVFSGDFSLEAAEQICSGEGIQEAEVLELLASLVDKSLVATQPTLPEARFQLHEIARQYAQRKLDAQSVHWQQRHLAHFVRLAEEAEPKLRGADQLEWLNRFDLEHENLRAALRLPLGKEGFGDPPTVDSAARLVHALWWFWFIRGHFTEGRHWAERAVAALEQHDPNSALLGKMLYVAATFCFFHGDESRAQILAQKSLSVCNAQQDIFGQVLSYHRLGQLSIRSDISQAAKYLDQGFRIAMQLGDARLIEYMLLDLGLLAEASGDLESALKWNEQALKIARQFGDKFAILYHLMNQADYVLKQGKLRQAVILTEESLSLSQMIGAKYGISFALKILGRIAMQEEQYQRAGELYHQSLQLLWSTRDRDSVIECLADLAEYEVQQERLEVAVRLLSACEAALTSFPSGHRLENQALFGRLVDGLQARLDPGIFTATWTLGGLMSLEQAVGFALLDRPPRPDRLE